MSHKKYVLVSSLFLALSVLLVSGQISQISAMSQPKNPTSYFYSIRGKITEQGSPGTPIAGVALKILRRDSGTTTHTYEGFTNASGEYVVNVSMPGKYKVIPNVNSMIKRFWPVYKIIQLTDNVQGVNFSATLR